MISNPILQKTLDGITEISRVELCAFETDGKIAASNFEDAKNYEDAVVDFADSAAENQESKGCYFFKVSDEGSLEYIILAKGGSGDAYMVGKMAAFQVQNLLSAYKDRFDKDNFVKSLLLDNMLLVDIYNRAKKLHIETEVSRIVIIIETQHEKDSNALEIVRNLNSSRTRDFITAVDEKNIIIVREVKADETYDDIIKSCYTLLDMLNMEAMSQAYIALGTVVGEIREVSKSYKEAKMALNVGKIFYDGQKVIAYSKLGIGRIIYQLPMPVCATFIKEIFGEHTPDSLDAETIETVTKFFENDFNVSETARKLYIHRNTLVYRLDKIQKITGLDVRNFNDAVTLTISLMVTKYMKYMETTNF